MKFKELLINDQFCFPGVSTPDNRATEIYELLKQFREITDGDQHVCAGSLTRRETWLYDQITSRIEQFVGLAEAPTRLIARIYLLLCAGTESFELQHIGADAAYLFGAIVEGRQLGCEWPASRPFIKLLRKLAEPTDPVWQYIQIEQPTRALRAKPTKKKRA